MFEPETSIRLARGRGLPEAWQRPILSKGEFGILELDEAREREDLLLLGIEQKGDTGNWKCVIVGGYVTDNPEPEEKRMISERLLQRYFCTLKACSIPTSQLCLLTSVTCLFILFPQFEAVLTPER